MNAATTRFLITAAALSAAHEVGDQWVQTGHQACTKGEPGRRGQLACAAHVATYSATGALAVWAASRWLGVPMKGRSLAAGLALNAATHYLADRRTPLRRLAALAGNAEYVRRATVVRSEHTAAEDTGPGTAMFHLDQSWHYGWIFASALLAAGRATPAAG